MHIFFDPCAAQLIMIALKNNRVTHLSGNIPIFFIYSDDQICGSVIIDKNLLFDGVSIVKNPLVCQPKMIARCAIASCEKLWIF
jgi:hypothetical protein